MAEESSNSYTEVASLLSSTSYDATGLTKARNYSFLVGVTNAVGTTFMQEPLNATALPSISVIGSIPTGVTLDNTFSLLFGVSETLAQGVSVDLVLSSPSNALTFNPSRITIDSTVSFVSTGVTGSTPGSTQIFYSLEGSTPAEVIAPPTATITVNKVVVR